MQMYRVKFRYHKATTSDVGEAIVVASSLEHACDVVSVILELPRSATSLEASREKPGLHLLSRQEVSKEFPGVATFPFREDDRKQYTVSASAFVWAHSEDDAIKRLAKSTLAEVNGSDKKPSKAVGMLQILCERKDLSPRSPAIEQNSIYTHPRIFAGGDARSA